MVVPERLRLRNNRPVTNGPVLYWMQRDQRAEDNWALLYAQECALKAKQPLIVVFNLVDTFGKATVRHYDFMFKGLAETAEALEQKSIPFVLLQGKPDETIPAFVDTHQIGLVVTDFNPLRFTDEWRSKVGGKLLVQLVEVDAHNIIPCWYASDKDEFAAYTFRPKVHKKLPDFLVDIPKLQTHPYSTAVTSSKINWDTLLSSLDIDRSVSVVTSFVPGARAGHILLDQFITEVLAQYDEKRNDPTQKGTSNLSPYLHFGQLSAQRVALSIKAVRGINGEAKDAFLEELIVRRELTDNYCFYNKNYDTIAGAHAWAQTSIAAHVHDTREFVYTLEQFERGNTHDDLWNAAQQQLIQEGKMHGWCRMYWAKKILEWTPDVQTAIDTALYLNDRYELDGNDPNGVVGVMWSICGVHDRAWTERPIFGKIRYMNYAGAKRKFSVPDYVAKYSEQTLF